MVEREAGRVSYHRCFVCFCSYPVCVFLYVCLACCVFVCVCVENKLNRLQCLLSFAVPVQIPCHLDSVCVG